MSTFEVSQSDKAGNHWLKVQVEVNSDGAMRKRGASGASYQICSQSLELARVCYSDLPSTVKWAKAIIGFTSH